MKYGFYSVVKKPLFNILIIIELAAILIVGNMTIAVYNSRSDFYEPYKNILTKDGFFFIGKGTGNYDSSLKIKHTLDELEGDVTVINNYGFQFITNDTTFIRNLESIDKNIFLKMKLPLEEGRWPSDKKNESGEIEAVVYKGSDKEDSRIKLGSAINGKINEKLCTIKIVGIIGNGQYVPALASNIHINNEVQSVMNYYTIPNNTDGCRFFVSSSADKILSDPHNVAMTISFVYYNSVPNDDVRQKNKEKIMGISKNLSYLSEYNENTLAYINEQYIKLMPILLCVFIIVVAELICSVAMNTKSQMKNYSIYFLCGCRWKDCLMISFCYSLIILTGGITLGSAAFFILENTEYAFIFEQHIAPNNFYITLVIAMFILILSLVIPFVQIRKTSPVETLKEV